MADTVGSQGEGLPGPATGRGASGGCPGYPVFSFPSVNTQPCPGSSELPGKAAWSFSAEAGDGPQHGVRYPSSRRAWENAPRCQISKELGEVAVSTGLQAVGRGEPAWTTPFLPGLGRMLRQKPTTSATQCLCHCPMGAPSSP